MTPESVLTGDFAALFSSGRPLLDVRAEIEFEKGAIPGSVNVPILSTKEREQVGTCYKHSGQEAAVALGRKLVSGEIREARVRRWVEFAKRNPDGALYCFRGGLRSKIAQDWLNEAGVSYPRVAGGYKALRQFLIGSLERSVADSDFVVVGGRTGSGKTAALMRAPARIDLEALAHHRGSAFGGFPDGQPSPVDFENRVAIALMRPARATLSCGADTGRHPIAIEDEGPNVGSLSVPKSLYEKASVSPLIIVEESMEKRVENILDEYIVGMLRSYGSENAERTWDYFSDYLTGSVVKINKRLGGTRTAEILAKMEIALARQKASGDVSRHRDWIRKILDFYYDPLYDSQLERKRERIVFQGTFAEVADRLSEQS